LISSYPSNMNVRVKLMGTLPTHYSGSYSASGIEVALPDGACIADLVEKMGISKLRVGLATINGKLVHAQDTIPAGAAVKFFHKIAGG
jgi:sulfur carrier protein ThiS